MLTAGSSPGYPLTSIPRFTCHHIILPSFCKLRPLTNLGQPGYRAVSNFVDNFYVKERNLVMIAEYFQDIDCAAVYTDSTANAPLRPDLVTIFVHPSQRTFDGYTFKKTGVLSFDNIHCTLVNIPRTHKAIESHRPLITSHFSTFKDRLSFGTSTVNNYGTGFVPSDVMLALVNSLTNGYQHLKTQINDRKLKPQANEILHQLAQNDRQRHSLESKLNAIDRRRGKLPS